MVSPDVETIEKLKHAPHVPGVLEIVLQRWSPRAFSDREVSPHDLKKLFEAARWASSSFNEQPWRFFVGRRGDRTYQKIFDSLMEFNQAWAKSAPVLILSIGKTTFSNNNSPNRFGLHDTGAATQTLALQAVALGMRAHSMGGFDTAKVREAFAIPSDYEIGAVTAVGYRGDPATLPGQVRERELEPRTRKPVEEIALAEWGQPAKF
jgi:nitroreductase